MKRNPRLRLSLFKYFRQYVELFDGPLHEMSIKEWALAHSLLPRGYGAPADNRQPAPAPGGGQVCVYEGGSPAPGGGGGMSGPPAPGGDRAGNASKRSCFRICSTTNVHIHVDGSVSFETHTDVC